MKKDDLSVFGKKLDILISDGQISTEEKEQIITIISPQPKELEKNQSKNAFY